MSVCECEGVCVVSECVCVCVCVNECVYNIGMCKYAYITHKRDCNID